jgi:hypothetical protein
MLTDNDHSLKGRVGKVAISVTLFFGVLSLIIGGAFEIAKFVHEFFEDTHPLATIIEAVVSHPLAAIFESAFCILLIFAGFWHSAARLRVLLESSGIIAVAKHFLRNKKVYLPAFAGISTGVSVAFAIMLVSPGLEANPKPLHSQHHAPKAAPKKYTEADQPKAVEPPLAPLQPAPQKLVEPATKTEPYGHQGTKTAKQNVCDIGNIFTDKQYAACKHQNQVHPNPRGTGGKEYYWMKLHGHWKLVPAIMPLKIHPHFR